MSRRCNSPMSYGSHYSVVLVVLRVVSDATHTLVLVATAIRSMGNRATRNFTSSNSITTGTTAMNSWTSLLELAIANVSSTQQPNNNSDNNNTTDAKILLEIGILLVLQMPPIVPPSDSHWVVDRIRGLIIAYNLSMWTMNTSVQ
jgi:hypothetical protein